MINNLVTVKEWFRTNKIYRDYETDFPQCGEVTKETEKAVLLNNRWWVPKSCIIVVAE